MSTRNGNRCVLFLSATLTEALGSESGGENITMEIRRLKVFPGAGKAGVLAPCTHLGCARFHRDPCSDRHRPSTCWAVSGHPEVTQSQPPWCQARWGTDALAQVGHGCTNLCSHLGGLEGLASGEGAAPGASARLGAWPLSVSKHGLCPPR